MAVKTSDFLTNNFFFVKNLGLLETTALVGEIGCAHPSHPRFDHAPLNSCNRVSQGHNHTDPLSVQFSEVYSLVISTEFRLGITRMRRTNCLHLGLATNSRTKMKMLTPCDEFVAIWESQMNRLCVISSTSLDGSALNLHDRRYVRWFHHFEK